jgi:hypothetical protein
MLAQKKNKVTMRLTYCEELTAYGLLLPPTNLYVEALTV